MAAQTPYEKLARANAARAKYIAKCRAEGRSYVPRGLRGRVTPEPIEELLPTRPKFEYDPDRDLSIPSACFQRAPSGPVLCQERKHEMTPDNCLVDSTGRIVCKACRDEAERQRHSVSAGQTDTSDLRIVYHESVTRQLFLSARARQSIAEWDSSR